MSLEAIHGAIQIQPSFGTTTALGADALPPNAFQNAAPSAFGQMVSQGINEVNQELLVSQTNLQQLAVGNVQNLHQIMIQLEESRLSFQLLLQVRNRLLDTYQDLMKMQI